MIYLIGGAPRTGKSIIAKRLMQELSIPWVSTDVFRTVANSLLSPEEQKIRFPYGGFTSADQLSDMDLTQMISWQITEGESLQTFIQSFIGHQIGVMDSHIIEGVHLLPQTSRLLIDEPTFKDQIKTLHIVSTDIDMQLAAMRKNTSHFDWLSGASDKTFEAVAHFVVGYGKWIKDECEKHQLPYIERKGQFEEENAQILSLLKS